MATTEQYLTQLQTDKQTLVNNLTTKGVNATNEETFTSLVPKVLNIQGETSDFEINDASYLFYRGARIDILDELISKISPLCTDFSYMLYNSNINFTLPQLDTSNGTNFNYMFYNCQNLTTIPQLNTNNGTTFSYMFGECRKITTIPQLNTSNGTNFNHIFAYCSKLEIIPQLDTNKATNMNAMFVQCSELTTIPQLNANSCNDCTGIFNYCTKLMNFGGLLNLGKNYTQKTSSYSKYCLTLSFCNQITHESLMNVINSLYDLNLSYNVANGGTLYSQNLILGNTNLAKLTEEEKEIAVSKGWTLS